MRCDIQQQNDTNPYNNPTVLDGVQLLPRQATYVLY